MGYYLYKNHVLYGEGAPGKPLDRLPEEGEILCLFRRRPLTGRETFPVTASAQLTAAEGPESLTANGESVPGIPADLEEAVRQGRTRAVNAAHPRWEELLDLPRPPEKRRVHLLALGDVGSTLALGLRLLGGDVLSAIGICDLRPNVAERWEFELNQINTPAGAGLPPVEIVDIHHIFDCDVFLFCASRFVPDTAVKTGDVRMAQYELNRELAASYGRMARENHFQGLFCVVSDPVDPLCRAVLLESNKNEAGELDGQGLFPHQVRGFGLGVMNARAAYYAQKDPRFADFLTDGRTFGPHGEGLVVANSIRRYDGALSRELTEKTKHANLDMRELGYKPYVAPALSSGALSLLLCLRGEWHCSSVFLDGIFMGVRNRLTEKGCEVEQLVMLDALLDRIRETMAELKMVELDVAAGDADTAIAVMREVSRWGRERGLRLWPEECLTREALVTEEAGPESFCVGAFGGETACAFILQWQDREWWPHAPAGEAAYLHKLCVRRDFAGKNVPAKVLDYIKRECKKRGAAAIRLDTAWDEETVKNIYLRLGFEIVGRKELPNGRVMALYEMKV